MNGQPVHRTVLADAFRQPDAPTLMTRILHKSTMSVTEVRSDLDNFGVTDPIPNEDAFLIALQLRECVDHDLFFDSKHVCPRHFEAGVTSIYDLRRDPIADLRSPFHSAHLHLPCKVLDAIAEEVGAPRIDELRYELGAGMDDPVVRHLILSLLPSLAKPAEASAEFVDHVTLALAFHVARTYGGMRAARRVPKGGLAPWQERRAKELLASDLSGKMTLATLAAECELSVRHFSRAFRQSTGVPPHRWLSKLRIERAKELLRRPDLTLADLALACGFSDQSHFTRTFSAVVGVSPGHWRRSIREG